MTENRVRQVMTAAATVGVAAVVAAAYAVGSGGGSTAQAASATTAGNIVTVDGAGQAAGTPDTMVTTIGVDTHGANPSAALASANQVMAVVQHALTGRGVLAKDLKTTGLSVNPTYTYAKGKQTLHGYQADEQLLVTLRDLPTAGATITSVLSAGGPHVTVQGISLDLQSDGALVTSARAAAYTDAKTKAQQYAALAHRSLGRVVSVSEQVNQPQSTSYNMAAGASAAAAAVPLQGGSQNVSVNVTVVWALS